VENRCHELGISEVHQGVSDKLKKLQEIVYRYDRTLQDVAYIGDDLNDLTCMKAIKAAQGLTGCPADADKELIQFCDFVSTKNGGEGAVREFIDYILGLLDD
jgi:3-deoxy-D-manno-octulosonate 8-phosphate phosphatase (KDO 8-P phosphatase)